MTVTRVLWSHGHYNMYKIWKNIYIWISHIKISFNLISSNILINTCAYRREFKEKLQVWNNRWRMILHFYIFSAIYDLIFHHVETRWDEQIPISGKMVFILNQAHGHNKPIKCPIHQACPTILVSIWRPFSLITLNSLLPGSVVMLGQYDSHRLMTKHHLSAHDGLLTAVPGSRV